MAKRRRRRSSKRQPARARSAYPRGLSALSVADLEAEIRRRGRGTAALHRRRNKVMATIAGLDAQILAAGGSLNGQARGSTGRVRPKNDTNLIDALKAALKGKTLGIAEAMDAIQKAGYRSNSANFRVMVNAALLKRKHFKKVERGRYTAA